MNTNQKAICDYVAEHPGCCILDIVDHTKRSADCIRSACRHLVKMRFLDMTPGVPGSHVKPARYVRTGEVMPPLITPAYGPRSGSEQRWFGDDCQVPDLALVAWTRAAPASKLKAHPTN